MPLTLPSESEPEGQQRRPGGDSIVKGKQLERGESLDYESCLCMLLTDNKKISVASYYPGRGDNTHVLASLDHGNRDTLHAPAVDDENSVTEEDLTDEEYEDAVELAHKHPIKISESVAVEVRFL